jgi:hypothetical protein
MALGNHEKKVTEGLVRADSRTLLLAHKKQFNRKAAEQLPQSSQRSSGVLCGLCGFSLRSWRLKGF